MSWLSDKRLMVTGFLGTHVVEALKQRGCHEIFVPRRAQFDLRQMAAVVRLYKKTRPQVVIHLAANAGGIGLNRAKPAELFYDNIMMGVQLLEQARIYGVEKFVAIGTVCAYPKFTPVPFREENLWSGYPEETNAPYGLAKKMLLVQAHALRQQYGFNAVYLLPVNLYGPGDNFDPESSHVIPALIRKCVEAVDEGKDSIEVWGSGGASREFLYVGDAAEAIVLATERYDSPEPVNVGSGQEITIRDLVALIARLTSFTSAVRWDVTKPDGQPRRRLDTSRAEKEFGFVAKTPLEVGLQRTICWFRAQIAGGRGDKEATAMK